MRTPLLLLVAWLCATQAAVAQLRFLPAVAYPFSADAIRATSYDFNRDNVPDFVVAGGGYHTCVVLLSQAGGGYAPAYYPTTGYCGGVALGNVNCDPYADVLASDFGTGSSQDGAVQVLLGQAGGRFAAPLAQPVRIAPLHVAAADLNGDGRSDFAALDLTSGSLNVRLSTGTCGPTYGPEQPYATASGAFSAVFTQFIDLNQDGLVDALVENQSSPPHTGLSVLLGQVGGTFRAAVAYPTGAGNPTDVAVADLNGDSYPDAVLALQGDNNLGICSGQQSGPLFGARVSYPLGANAVDVAIADFNNDQQPDVAAVLASGSVVVLLGQAGGTLAPPVAVGSVGASFANGQLLAVDVNQDGKTDLAVAGRGNLYVLLATVAVPLPVTLLSFRAQRSGGLVALDWFTANEQQNQGFTVEVSAEGQHWHSLAQVSGLGTSSQPQAYGYVDARRAAGYYRLRQQDVNGASTYSPVRYVGAYAAAAAATIYPNPAAQGHFWLAGDPNATQVRVTDLRGRLVGCTARAGEVALAGASAGIYVVAWHGGDGQAHHAKVVVP